MMTCEVGQWWLFVLVVILLISNVIGWGLWWIARLRNFSLEDAYTGLANHTAEIS